jgi:hypothetical protein
MGPRHARRSVGSILSLLWNLFLDTSRSLPVQGVAVGKLRRRLAAYQLCPQHAFLLT